MRTARIGAACASVLLLASTSTVYAALEERLGGQAVYNSDLNITWLANANLAATNTFGVTGVNPDGSMFWGTANNWIAALNRADYLGYNDWRLPFTLQSDPTCDTQYPQYNISMGYSCKGSDLGQLFNVEFAGLGVSSPKAALFTNIQTGFFKSFYWTGTDYPGDPSEDAEVFDFSSGWEGAGPKYYANNGIETFVWAVRTGDVSSAPEPAALGLLAAGLAMLGATRSRRRRCVLHAAVLFHHKGHCAPPMRKPKERGAAIPMMAGETTRSRQGNRLGRVAGLLRKRLINSRNAWRAAGRGATDRVPAAPGTGALAAQHDRVLCTCHTTR